MEPYDHPSQAIENLVDQLVHVFAGLLVVLLIIWAVMYVIMVIPRAKLFKLAGYPAWQAWVPFVNVFVQAKITGRSPWLILGLYLGLPVLTYLPLIGGVFWLLPTLLTMWMCYELALVYGQSKGFSLWFAIITASTVNSSFSGGLWNTLTSLMSSADYGTSFAGLWGALTAAGGGIWVQLLNLIALVLIYILAFSSGTHYEGPYSHRHERMMMHEPWLFIPGPNQSIPVPPTPAYRPAHAGYEQPQGYHPSPAPAQSTSVLDGDTVKPEDHDADAS